MVTPRSEKRGKIFYREKITRGRVSVIDVVDDDALTRLVDSAHTDEDSIKSCINIPPATDTFVCVY